MKMSKLPEEAQKRLDQVLDLIAHISFGKLDVTIPLLLEDDAFADLFIGLEILVADLRETREELEEEVRVRTEALEEDIRQRKRVEARLRASEATYRMWVETSPDPIALCDKDGRVRMVNPSLLQAFRLDTVADIIDRPWVDLVMDQDRPKAADYARDTGDPLGVRTAELSFLRRDGSCFVGEVSSSVMRGVEDGDDGGRQYVIHDVTERRHREQEQLRAEKIESIGTLAGGIAHDFNNTLTAITGCLGLAKKMLSDEPKVRKLLTNAMDAAFRATSLTQQLLTFSKGGMPMKTSLHIGELVERVADFCVRGSNVRCAVEVSDDVWPVEGDAGQIEQLVGNLVINAQQSMPDGGVVKVSVGNYREPPPGTSDQRRFVRIAIEDAGVGISAENLSRIYDPYFSTKDGGSGLGLATAYSVAKKHGGRIDCDSLVGRGSVFTTYLPASKRRVVSRTTDAPPPDRGQGNILVMDDEDLVRQVTVEQLRDAGYDVVAVECGEDAVSAYRRALANGNPFSLVLLDLTVPGGDGGRETMRKLLAMDSSVRGVVVSGYSDDPVLASYRDYGFIACLTKPYRPRQLLRIVASSIRDERRTA